MVDPQALIIGLTVGSAALLLIIAIIIACVCCRKCERSCFKFNQKREDIKYQRERTELTDEQKKR